eukprot:COSAG01_NODE_446_length_16939_cov_19.753518_9_plen_171_part_00
MTHGAGRLTSHAAVQDFDTVRMEMWALNSVFQSRRAVAVKKSFTKSSTHQLPVTTSTVDIAMKMSSKLTGKIHKPKRSPCVMCRSACIIWSLGGSIAQWFCLVMGSIVSVIVWRCVRPCVVGALSGLCVVASCVVARLACLEGGAAPWRQCCQPSHKASPPPTMHGHPSQ